MRASKSRSARNKPNNPGEAYRFETDVFAREVQRIDVRRDAASLKRLSKAFRKPTAKLGLIGLALSGGGIRSATFSLGVIQSLVAQGVFHKIDYLSTVSGGGYIGSCLTSLLNDASRQDSVAFPLADHDGQQASPMISHLRSNADYLSPGGTAGRLRLVAMVLRGMGLNMLLVLQAVLFATSLTAFVYWGLKYLRDRLALARCDVNAPWTTAAGQAINWMDRRGWAAVITAAIALGGTFLVVVRRRRAAHAVRVAEKGDAPEVLARGWEARERRELRNTGLLAALVGLCFCYPLYRLVSFALDTPLGTRHGLKAMWWSTVLGRSHALWWCAGAALLIAGLCLLRSPIGRWTRRLALYGVGVLGPSVPVLLYLLLCMMLIHSPYIDPDLMVALRDCAQDNVLGCGGRMPNLKEWEKVLNANGLNVEGRRWSVRRGEAEGAWIATIDGTDMPLLILEPLSVIELRSALHGRGIEVDGHAFDVARGPLGWTIEVNGEHSPPFESIELSQRLRRVMLMRELQEVFNAKGLDLKEGHWTVVESSGFSFRGEAWRGAGPRGAECILGDGSSAPVWIVSTLDAGGVQEVPLLFDQQPRVAAALTSILDDCRAHPRSREGGSDQCSDDTGMQSIPPHKSEELKSVLGEQGLSLKGDIVGVRLASGLKWAVKTDEGHVFPVVPERGQLQVRNLGLRVGLSHGRNGIALSLALWLASVVLFRLIDVNKASLSGVYRDRLSRLFLIRIDPRTEEIVHCDDLKLSALKDHTAAPYQLINATLNLQVNKGHKLHSRQADFFVFSQYFAGSEHTGYCGTKDMEKEDDRLDLGTAMAISAAAAAPTMGTLTIKPLVFIMTLLNLRLAYWVPNPREVCLRAAEAQQSIGDPSALRWLRDKLSALNVRRPGLRYFVREALGQLSTDGPYVNVSDGGHLENTGIYQLLRRRCKLIIAVDGEADPEMEFTSLMSMMRYARIDLGVQFEDVKLEPIRRVDGLSKEHWMLATIRYSTALGEEPEIGYLLYIKSSMTGDEPEYLRAYKRFAPAFPHHSTADQFFNETQFEAYRALGEHVGSVALHDSRVAELLLTGVVDRESMSDAHNDITSLSLS